MRTAGVGGTRGEAHGARSSSDLLCGGAAISKMYPNSCLPETARCLSPALHGRVPQRFVETPNRCDGSRYSHWIPRVKPHVWRRGNESIWPAPYRLRMPNAGRMDRNLERLRRSSIVRCRRAQYVGQRCSRVLPFAPAAQCVRRGAAEMRAGGGALSLAGCPVNRTPLVLEAAIR